MKQNIVTLSLVAFLVGCGGGGSSTPTETAEEETTIEQTTVDSFESTQKSLETNGYTLEKLVAPTTQQSKPNNDEVIIHYNATENITLSTTDLYLITNENSEVVLATLDANATLDEIESKSKLLVEHIHTFTPTGYTNLNTIKTNPNATPQSILTEVQKAFTQFTLNNPSSPESIVENSDINISYQTALKNSDEPFTCNAENQIIDAQKGYTTLSNLTLGEVVCSHGEIPLVSFDVLEKNDEAPTIEFSAEARSSNSITIKSIITDSDSYSSEVSTRFVITNAKGENAHTPFTINGTGSSNTEIQHLSPNTEYTITATVSDGTNEKVETITVTTNKEAEATPTPALDTDNDGIPDSTDTDIDGDGYTNTEEEAAGSDPLDKDNTPETVANAETDFSGLSTFTAGPTVGLQGTITDADGIASVVIDFSDGTQSSYSNGNLSNESSHNAGTEYTITVTDGKGKVTVETGIL